MRRVTYLVTLTDTARDRVEATATAHAMNSGIRASEALARTAARQRQVILTGQSPHRDGDCYTRVWTDGTTEFCATVEQATNAPRQPR